MLSVKRLCLYSQAMNSSCFFLCFLVLFCCHIFSLCNTTTTATTTTLSLELKEMHLIKNKQTSSSTIKIQVLNLKRKNLPPSGKNNVTFKQKSILFIYLYSLGLSFKAIGSGLNPIYLTETYNISYGTMGEKVGEGRKKQTKEKTKPLTMTFKLISTTSQ